MFNLQDRLNPVTPDSAGEHALVVEGGAAGALAEIARLWPDKNVWDEHVILEDGVPVGFLTVREVEGDVLWIGEIYLAPGRERQGIGSALLDRICAIADRFQCGIGLEAFWRPDTPDGGWLARWYEGRGFVPASGPDDHHLVVFMRPDAPTCDPERAGASPCECATP